MNIITISETDDRLLISVSKTTAGAEILREVAEKIRFEELSSQADYDEYDLMELGKEIKKQWWEKHQSKIEKDIESFSLISGEGK